MTASFAEKNSDPELSSLQKAMDGLYLPLKEILRASSKGWKIQMGFGQCSATADQYIALLPPEQKVSNGVYFVFVLDTKVKVAF